MKITRGQLKRIINEEAERLSEVDTPAGKRLRMWHERGAQGSFGYSVEFDKISYDIGQAAARHKMTPQDVCRELIAGFDEYDEVMADEDERQKTRTKVRR